MGGDDVLSDPGGSDTLLGGDGNDLVNLIRGANAAVENLRVETGAGDDRLFYQNVRGGTLSADMGDGADVVVLAGVQSGGATFTLGAGRDVVQFAEDLSAAVAGLVVMDFAAGATGDRLEWTDWLNRSLIGWNGNGDPFGAGFLRFGQVGADAVLEIDRDGAAGTAR